MFFNTGWFDNESYEIYRLEDANESTRDAQNPESIIEIMIFAKGDVQFRSRAIYNALDLLGDVGGLFDALKLLAQALISLIGQGGLSTYLIGKLFYLPQSRSNQGPNGFNHLDESHDQIKKAKDHIKTLQKAKLSKSCWLVPCTS